MKHIAILYCFILYACTHQEKTVHTINNCSPPESVENSPPQSNPFQILPDDTCKSVLFQFNYPRDVFRLDSLNYRCTDEITRPILISNNLENFTIIFEDKGYTLLRAELDRRVRILIDRKDSVILAFKGFPGKIWSIYVLDSKYMPLFEFGITRNDSCYLIIEKINYLPENDFLEIERIKYNNDHLFCKNRFGYKELIKVSKDLLNGKNYISNSKFILDGFPKTTPLWSS